MTGELITALYVPGDRPDRFDKAAASGAQLVIVDLEDAVAPASKGVARNAVAAWIAARAAGGPAVEVRINAGDTDDLAALRQLVSGAPFGVRIPKVETPADIELVANALPGTAITALIETAKGVEHAGAIAALEDVAALALGEADLAADLGSTDPTTLDYARTRILYAARANNLPAPMMSVYPNIADLDGLRRHTERGRAQGFVGRAAIHPTQLPVIRAVFEPTDAELRWARDVLDAVEAGGVATIADGEMVDAAMVRRAQRILHASAMSSEQ